MWSQIYSLLGSAIGRTTPAVQSAAAQSISRLTGATVAPTVKSIVNAVQRYIGNNPVKTMIASNALIGAGVTIGTDKLLQVFEENQVAMDALQMIAAEVDETWRKQREQQTGDGNPDTIDGLPQDDYANSVRRNRVVAEKIRRACAILGVTPESLKAIREIMFIEEVDIDLYIEGNRS